MQKNKFSVGEKIEVMQPFGKTFEFTLEDMQNEKGEIIDSAPHGKMLVRVKLPHRADVNSMLRKEK